MKMIQCIIRPTKLQEVKKALIDAGIIGMTVREVRGCGRQRGFVQHYRSVETLVNLLPKTELEIVVNDEQVDQTIDIVCEASKTGEPGDGKIFVFDVLEAVRIRTKEKGKSVL
jgi:nitrogen regulatory protein P-II 1